jgi:hypothetical protein
MEGGAPELKQRIQDMHDLYSYVEQELPLLLERWEREHQKEV